MLWPNFVAGVYQMRSQNIDAEACTNLFPATLDIGDNAKQGVLYGTPGLRSIVTAPEVICRVMFYQDGRTFTVIGSSLYEATITGSGLTVAASLTRRGSLHALGTDGLPVDVLSSPATGLYIRPASGATFPVSIAATVAISAAAAVPVSAPVGTPAFVRLSDGTNPIATLPVSGTIAVTQSTPAAASAAWMAKITDGTDIVGISTLSSDKALKVDVIQSVGTVAPADEAAFTAGATKTQPVAGVFNDSLGDPSSGHEAATLMTH